MTATALPNPFVDPAIAAIIACEAEFAPEMREHDQHILALKLETAVAGALKGRLTKSQVRWAASHDWFVADLGNGLIQIVDSWVNIKTGERGEDVLVWDKSFAELRSWAGY
jgi:hypothetical protein